MSLLISWGLMGVLGGAEIHFLAGAWGIIHLLVMSPEVGVAGDMAQAVRSGSG